MNLEIETEDILNKNNNLICEEQDILSEINKAFSPQIINRGKGYYYSKKVMKCFKHNNTYYAKVLGSNDNVYDVEINIGKKKITCNCTCPCEFLCKHEYAVLMTIANEEYSLIDLKDKIKEKKDNLQDIIKNIPAEELKKYLLSPVYKDFVYFERNCFDKYFRKYLPIQSYEFYYNNLYNTLVLNKDYEQLVNDYLIKTTEYLSNNCFTESFKIIKSIIEVYNDTSNLNFDNYISAVFYNIGMYLRITFRKADNNLKEEINTWLNKVKDNNYYNNFYLEDIIVTLK